MNEPQHVFDQIEAYLSDGLSTEERPAFESHVANCGLCAEALADARNADQELRKLFQDSRPDAALEDRVIQNLRVSGSRQRIIPHPMLVRAVTGVAAVVALGATGLTVSNAIDGAGSPFQWASRDSARERAASASNLRQIGQAITMSTQQNRSSQSVLSDSFPALARQERSVRRLYDATDSNSLAQRATEAEGAKRLESEVRQLSESGKFGEALQADTKLLQADPANTYAYQLKGKLQQEYGLGLMYEPKAGVAGGPEGKDEKKEAIPEAGTANKPAARGDTQYFRAGDQPERFGRIATGRSALGNSWHYTIDSFRPGDQLHRELERDGKGVVSKGAPPFDVQDNILVPVSGAGSGGGSAPAAKEPGQATAVTGLVGPAPAAAKPADEPAPQSAAPQQPAPPRVQTNPMVATGRKVIRNGTMEFEVLNFDDALTRITKLVAEQGGFIATTDSDKLPNGKMKGNVTLRVPPEHLDTLVLTLRGIGDLKSQKIGAEDVTKHYTDLESGLRAARAMEDRLLEIVKTGKGAIKDLLEAEKQLGVWREKIEQIEGEKRYLDNLISLSTLTVELYEKDIKTPATASETEQVTMAVETEQVDQAYEKARAAIEAAKGRIIQSELKQYDAGQFGATVQAAIPADAGEEVIARLKQLPGRIAHFARDSRRTTQSGEAPAPGTVVRHEDMVVSMQIYNLANVAPRRTTNMQVAAANVDRTYHQVIDQVRSAGGRIVTSALTRPDAAQQTADVDFQVPSDKADGLLETFRTYGEVMRQDSAENPDTANVTEAKRGFHLKLVSLAAVPARETQAVQLAAPIVPEAFNEIVNAVKSADGRILQSDLNEQNRSDVTGTLAFEVSRAAAEQVNTTIGKAAQALTRTVNRSPDTENTVDTKLHLVLTLVSADRLPPRQTVTTSREEVPDVQRAVDDLANAAVSNHGRRMGGGEISQDHAGEATGHVLVDVPLDKLGVILDQLEKTGNRRSQQVTFDNTVPDGPLARARIEATFSNTSAPPGAEESTWDAIRRGLATSGKGLRWSLTMLVVGFCFVAPWVLVLGVIWRLLRRSRARTAPVVGT